MSLEQRWAEYNIRLHSVPTVI